MKKLLPRSAVALLVLGALFAYACAKTSDPALARKPAAKSVPGMVDVRLSEYRIDVPDSIRPGNVTLHVANDGRSEHTIEIVGNGVAVNLGTPLQPGESRIMKVDLRPGSYEVYCPIGDEDERGMRATLTVG